MTSEDFLKELRQIEKKLSETEKGSPQEWNFLVFLQRIYAENLLSKGAARDLILAYEMRNKIMSASSGKLDISPEDVERIQRIKSELSL